MHKRTKALDITPAVKSAVWERDKGRCILCGSPMYAFPNAHYISRAQGGLGIEENIVTLCQVCHDRYDNGAGQQQTKAEIRDYLMRKYQDWDESRLRYRK